jgi:hypothetical protein
MRLSYIQKRIVTLETRIRPVDEVMLAGAAMTREHYRSHGLPCPPHVLDRDLDALAIQESLPAGTPNLIQVAWEILRNPGPLYLEAELCD